MSTEKVEVKPYLPRSEQYRTVDHEVIVMDVDKVKYHITMKQNGESRFISFIEEALPTRRTRVFVPMSVTTDFCAKVVEVINFCKTLPKTDKPAQKPTIETISTYGRQAFLFSTQLTTAGWRRYYFDIVGPKSEPCLRLSYAFGEKRDCVHIFAAALPNLIKIFQKYQEKYPSISDTDDYPANVPRRNFGNRRGNGAPYQTFNGRGGYRDNRAPRSPPQYNGQPTYAKEPIDPKRATTLKVLSDPTPTQLVSNTKKFTFEVVEGANTFMRITEMINETRKSTLHIPMEVCAQLQAVIGEMNKKYAALIAQKSVPATNKA